MGSSDNPELQNDDFLANNKKTANGISLHEQI
jgi:hypothetical protein